MLHPATVVYVDSRALPRYPVIPFVMIRSLERSCLSEGPMSSTLAPKPASAEERVWQNRSTPPELSARSVLRLLF